MRLFQIHDADFFFGRLGPGLARSARDRSFGPLAELVNELAVPISEVASRFHLTAAEAPLILTCATARFDRRLWRHYAGELLLYAAAETPAIRTAPESLARFMTVEFVERIHRGTRDVIFDVAPYRPGQAGLHDRSDLAELAARLAMTNDAAWTPDALPLDSDDDPVEELTFTRQCFADLRAMIESAQLQGQVIVCEEI